MKTGKYGRQILALILSLGMVMPLCSAGEWTAYARSRKMASASDLFREERASASNVSRSRSDERSMVPAALTMAETEDIGLDVYHSGGEFTDEEFTFTYTTVNHQEREMTVEQGSTHGIVVLTQTCRFERDGDTYKGFKVLGMRIELPTGYDEDDEEAFDTEQDMQAYYANSIGEGEYCANMLMELTGDEAFTGELYYTEDADPEDAEWENYEDASLSGQRYNIKLWQPRGWFLAKVEPREEKEEKGKALIITLSGDATLQDTPDADGDALRSTLIRTEQFSAEDITILNVPSGSKEDYKSKIWDWIDAAAEEEGLRLIAYSGHGNFLDDGSAELSMGDNAISAYELKQHVSQLKGKLVMMFDSCFSGGMILPTALEGEETEDAATEAAEAAQQQAEDGIATFVDDLKSEETESENQAALQYYIYAAGSAYETTIQGIAGGQLFRSFGYALGYDRHRGTYHVFAADTDGDGCITAGELGQYIRNAGLYSTPSIYPEDSDEVLFRYGEETGIPAAFSVKRTDSGNIRLNEDGSVDVSVLVTNHSEEDISFDAFAARVKEVNILMPGSYEDCLSRTDAGNLFYQEEVNQYNVPAHEAEEFTLHFEDARHRLEKGGRFLIRLWGTEETAADHFAVTDFYIANDETENEEIDKAAFQIQKPGNVNAAENAVKVSSILPVVVRFDREPTKKTGYAACTLTARALDLGESQAYTTDEQGRILDSQGQESDTTKCQWIMLYEDLRPQYVREERYTTTEQQAAYYSYMWDVAGLTKGHYYALQILCHYDDGTEATKTTFLQSVTQEEADATTYVIAEHYIEMSYFPQSYSGGIRLGEGWDNAGEDSTVKKASENFLQLLKQNSYRYDGESGTETKNMQYSIADENGGSGWYQVDADGKLTAMPEDAHFEQGGSYVTRITMRIDENWNAVFAEGTNFRVGGHSLYDNSPYRTEENADGAIPYTSGTDPENPKQAVIYVLHQDIGVPEDALKVCRADSSTPLAAEETLCVGDEIDVYVPNGYSISAAKSVSGLEKVKSTGKYTRYRVLGNLPRIKIRMYRPNNDNIEQSCRCASVLYSYKVEDAEGAVYSITAPDKIFYERTAQGELELTGGKISYYTSRYKRTTRTLEKFMSIYENCLYIYDADEEAYQPWDNAFLNVLGSHTLYIFYKGRHYEAFTIEVGHVQGDDFVVEAEFGDKTAAAEAVLCLSVQTETENTEKGSIRVQHEVKRNTGGKLTTLPVISGSISYMIPYPDGLDSNDTYEVKDGNANVPVQLEKRAEGLWITANRNGSFNILYRKEEQMPDTKPEPVPDATPDTKPEPVPDVTPDTKPEPVPDVTPDTKPEPVPDATPDTKPEPVPDLTPDRTPEWTPPVSTGRKGGGGAVVRSFRKGLYGKGWKLVNRDGRSSWYYFGEDGRMCTGWLQLQGKWYYLQPDGRMATGWIHLGTDWYYLDTNGVMLTGETEIEGKIQSFLPDGRWIAS